MRHTALVFACGALWCARSCVYMDKVVVALAMAFFCVMVWGVLELAAAIKSSNNGETRSK